MAGSYQNSLLVILNYNRIRASKALQICGSNQGSRQSIPHNIVESTGTYMIGEQKQLLRFAKRECFEAATILVLLLNEYLIDQLQKDTLFERLDILNRRIQSYSNSLK
ncbi:MAG: four helix bundle protein [Saprospiraceae bacterium]|nr:four helix bundle protein [Saprospiraceae bacterium]